MRASTGGQMRVGFLVQDSGFRIKGISQKLRIKGLGCRILGPGIRS
jgi:hypothetical protein